MIHHFVVSAGTNQINIEELEPRPIINKVTIHINKLHKHQKDIRHENKLVSVLFFMASITLNFKNTLM